jgi:hypothetical protein
MWVLAMAYKRAWVLAMASENSFFMIWYSDRLKRPILV